VWVGRHLKVFVLFVLCDSVTGNQVELDVQCILRTLAVLELLHLVGLFQPALENSTHTLHGTLGQLMSPTLVVINPPVTTATIFHINSG